MVNETRKILGDDSIRVTATAVRVPVFIGHSEAVNVEIDRPVDIAEIKAWIAAFPGVELMDDPMHNVYPTPQSASGKDPAFVGRIRKDVSCERAFDMWVVADNLRKGAALNSIQIAEALVAQKLI